MKTEYFPLYYMDLSTGLRRGELLGLKYGDINFDTGVLNISRQLQLINGKLVTSSLKTKHSKRSIQYTFSALALQNGVDIKTLQKDLGHHSAAFTLDVYGHITPQMETQKAKKIGDFLSSQINKIKEEDKSNPE